MCLDSLTALTMFVILTYFKKLEVALCPEIRIKSMIGIQLNKDWSKGFFRSVPSAFTPAKSVLSKIPIV
jgi:hypothetical protein